MAWDVTIAELRAHQAIEARIISEWVVGPSLRCPVQFPAVLGLRTSPTDATAIIAAPTTGQSWMKVDVLNAETTPFSRCGDHGMNKTLVLVQLTLYCPRQKGLGELKQLAGYAKAIFSRKFNSDGLQPSASSFVLTDDERGWIRGIVRTSVEFFEEVVG